jgi:hypothetical protein
VYCVLSFFDSGLTTIGHDQVGSSFSPDRPSVLLRSFLVAGAVLRENPVVLVVYTPRGDTKISGSNLQT